MALYLGVQKQDIEKQATAIILNGLLKIGGDSFNSKDGLFTQKTREASVMGNTNTKSLVIIVDRDMSTYQAMMGYKNKQIQYRWFDETRDSLNAMDIYAPYAGMVLYNPQLDSVSPPEALTWIDQIKTRYPKLPVVIFTSQEWPFLQVFEWKADGYLNRHSSSETIATYIQEFIRSRK